MVSVNLPPDLEDDLRRRVQAGEFESIEFAIQYAIRRLLAPDAHGSWDELLREATEQADRGDVVDGEAFFEQMRIESLRLQGKLP